MNRKIILITGATSGIGKHIAMRLLEAGAIVIINYGHNDEQASKTIKEFKAFSDNVLLIKADISNELEIKKMFNIIEEKYGTIDVLINNAVFDRMSSLENYNYLDFQKILNTNILGKVFCIQQAIPLLKKSNYPNIINIASRLGIKPMDDSAAYCCSAAATIMLTKCAALELGKYKIKVNTVSPSLTLTPLSKKSYTKEQMKSTARKSLKNRLCEPEDIYKTIKFLINDDSDFITGENINVSGGLLLI